MSERIAQIEERLAAATPGPWQQDLIHDQTYEIRADGYLVAETWDRAPDATLIAHAPSDLAWLLGVAKAAREVAHKWVTDVEPMFDIDDAIDALCAALESEG